LRKSAEITSFSKTGQDFVCPVDDHRRRETISQDEMVARIQTVENHIMPIGVNQSLMRYQQH
jgi:hypothetical protein